MRSIYTIIVMSYSAISQSSGTRLRNLEVFLKDKTKRHVRSVNYRHRVKMGSSVQCKKKNKWKSV